jgi:Putative MetA-pathway of phenol degradation
LQPSAGVLCDFIGVHLGRYLLFTLSLIAAGGLRAAEVPTNSGATAAEQLKQLNDQTIIGSRLLLDSEWDHFKQGAEKATWTLAGLWGRRISERQDWAIRLKLPFVYERGDEASGHADTGGIGDIEVGTATAFRLSNTWRTAGGIELHADTASDPALAENVWRLKSGWGIAHDVTNWFTLTFNAEYNHSIAEQHNVAPQRYLELSLPGVILLPHDWSTFAKYNAKIDFENGDRRTHTISAGIAKRLPNVPVVLSATLEKSLSVDAKKFQANVTIVYYFERYHAPK